MWIVPGQCTELSSPVVARELHSPLNLSWLKHKKTGMLDIGGTNGT